MSTLVRRPALIPAALAPVFFIGGTIIAGALWPEHDPATQTISELAAGDTPTRVFMSVMFMFTAVCHGVTGVSVTGVFATRVGLPGRLALIAASVASFAVALSPLPAIAGSSKVHSASASAGFILLAVWPALGTRQGKGYPWIIRVWGAILDTSVMSAFCFWFRAVRANPVFGDIGVIERVTANLETLWPLITVLGLCPHERTRPRQAP